LVVDTNSHGEISVAGDKQHPSNYGRICSKGAALAETLDHDGRLLEPEISGVTVALYTALEHVAGRFRDCIDNYGPESVAFYVSGQLLTEDYYVANKLMKGFICVANIDTNSRLCMSSAVAGHKRAFGSDTVPCSYTDLEHADFIVLTGSNTAWCHPVLFQRIDRAKQQNPALEIVVIDPRRSPTCDIADLHLPLKPGTDTVLFNGLLVYLYQHGRMAEEFVQQHTEGLDAALAAALEVAPDIACVAEKCGLAKDSVERFYRRFAQTEKVITVFSQGVNQFSYGTDKVNSIINCHLLTGRIGREGMGPFSFTGQPNAMGGREVGGLANQLTAHMELENPEDRNRVQHFWDSPAIADKPGYKAVELFSAMAKGDIKAVWIMATNPAVSLPNSEQVRLALEKCDFVVVSDCIRHTDTTAFADVLLPALSWGEKDGTVTNSERRISRQRRFMNAPGNAREDWWIISQIAQRMGFGAAFDYQSAREIFTEFAALSGLDNRGSRDFDISALANLDCDAYEQLSPVQWPVNFSTPSGTRHMFTDGRFYTDSRRARFISVGDRQTAQLISSEYPLVLNTGRVRDHWHTMTRTGKSVRLSAHRIEPYVEIAPGDARHYQITEGDLVKVASKSGELIVRARISEEQLAGCLFIPMHWNGQFSSLSSVDTLIGPAVDPVSGQPEFKYTPVRIKPYRPAWQGFVLSGERIEVGAMSYWACTKAHRHWRYEIAGDEKPEDWPRFSRALLEDGAADAEWIEFSDPAVSRYRAARLVGGRIQSCLFIEPGHSLPARNWLGSLFDNVGLTEGERASLLSGRPAAGGQDTGRIVCACFSVGINTLREAIQGQHLSSVEEIGAHLRAGSNCGSCVPELKQLLEESTELLPAQ